MTKLFDSLRTRLLLSHLIVVVVGAVTIQVAASQLAPTLLERHLQAMEDLSGSMMNPQLMVDFRQSALSGFGQALFLAALLSTAVAIVVAVISSVRLLRPLDAISATTRRLAAGSYSERVVEPRESELAALAADVNSLASTLEETEQRRLHLISEVSHELRTPLATIKGYMEALVDGVLPVDEAILTAVGREAARLERLAIDLHELSRSEEGRYELRLEPVDLTGLVSEVAARLKPQFDDQEVILEIASDGPLPVEVDRDRMTQVFTNIIGNALTYTPPGGQVTIKGRVNNGEVRIRVTDTGQGLAKSQVDAVFERFYRADRSVPGGSGIGLTIARTIARRHGGDITASSPGPSLGSTFTITVPLAATGEHSVRDGGVP